MPTTTTHSNWIGSTIELNADEYPLYNGDDDASDPLLRSNYRVIGKNGRENVNIKGHIPEKSWRFLRDFVTTLMELKWKYVLSIFIGSYFCGWLLFATLAYLSSYAHGDFKIDEITGERLHRGRAACVTGVYDFVSMLLYSIEIQTTIGFGEKYPNDVCPATIFLFIMQIICSIAIEGGMISIIYAKTARPAKQLTKMKFSDKAVICYRDGQLCLLFRVCDPRQQQTIESKIRVYMIMDIPTKEGEHLKTHTELKLQGNGQQIIVWPEIICHVIDASSPLFVFKNARDLLEARFELCVSIVGESVATCQVTEARTSYVPCEIYWGQRFINIIHYDDGEGCYVIDYKNFNSTISVDMTKKLK